MILIYIRKCLHVIRKHYGKKHDHCCNAHNSSAKRICPGAVPSPPAKLELEDVSTPGDTKTGVEPTPP